MRTKLTALAVLSACAALCAQARADEVYSYTGTTPYAGVPNLTIMLNIADAAVTAGAFNLSGGAAAVIGAQPSLTGDVTDFISLLSSPTGLITRTSVAQFTQFSINLTFDGAGDVSSSHFNSTASAGGNATISGTGLTASGAWGNDNPVFSQCDPKFNTCPFSGSWTRAGDPISSPVPEPASLALLGAGLIGLAVRRRVS